MMSIVYATDLQQIDSKDRELYEKPIYMFSYWEKKKLLALHDLFENPKRFLTDIYKPRERADSYTMVYEGKRPAYHEDIDCENLNSDYENFKIPKDIIEKGEGEVIAFRKWFKANENDFHNRPDIFVVNLNMRWGIQTNVKAINLDNSGALKMENRKIEDLKKAIDERIKGAGRFYYKSNKETEILKEYSKLTYQAYDDEVEFETENYKDSEEIRKLLKYYDETFKKPLSEDLTHYYRYTLNPKLKLDGKLLDNLGFKACTNCV